MNDYQNAAKQVAVKRALSKLEGVFTGGTHDLCANLDELVLKVGQRPVPLPFGQFSAL